MESEIKNATIKSTALGPLDRGILTCFINVEGEGWGCGFGGYRMDRPLKEDITKRAKSKFDAEGTSWGMEFISRVLWAVDVTEWEDLPGKNVRVDTEGLGGGILGIGHITKNRWFYPKKDLEYLINR